MFSPVLAWKPEPNKAFETISPACGETPRVEIQAPSADERPGHCPVPDLRGRPVKAPPFPSEGSMENQKEMNSFNKSLDSALM